MNDSKMVKLLLKNDLMPTRYTIENEPKIELLSFCKKHRMGPLANRVLKEQLFESVDKLDIEYIESILIHGIDINIKIIENNDNHKSSLYYLVEQPFNIYDELDAKDQFETIECLLKNGANPNLLDETKTPMIIYPLQRNGHWNLKLVDILCSFGVNLNSKVGHTNKTIYQYAKENCVSNDIFEIVSSHYNNKTKTDNLKLTSMNVKKSFNK